MLQKGPDRNRAISADITVRYQRKDTGSWEGAPDAVTAIQKQYSDAPGARRYQRVHLRIFSSLHRANSLSNSSNSHLLRDSLIALFGSISRRCPRTVHLLARPELPSSSPTSSQHKVSQPQTAASATAVNSTLYTLVPAPRLDDSNTPDLTRISFHIPNSAADHHRSPSCFRSIAIDLSFLFSVACACAVPVNTDIPRPRPVESAGISISVRSAAQDVVVCQVPGGDCPYCRE